MFQRSKYYSLTDVIKLYPVSSSTYKQLLEDYKVEIVKKDVDLGGFSVISLYVLIEDVMLLMHQAGIPLRIG